MPAPAPKQIISVSRRTDIPAFYSEWFMNRIRAGYCTVPNPYNPSQVSRVSLKPDDVRALVFWTRNPRPLMKYLPELDALGFKYYFLNTIIGYPAAIDPSSPPIDTAVKTFKELSQLLGKERIIWRYDPMLLSNLTPVEWHIEQIQKLTGQLRGFTDKVIFSFVEPYRKTCARLQKETGTDFKLSPDAFNPAAYEPILKFLSEAAAKENIKVQSCSEEISWLKYGISNGKCIDDELIAHLAGQPFKFKKDPSQRQLCNCIQSKDIGAPNTCMFGCRYCYATVSMTAAGQNYREHDPSSPSLIGWHEKKENEKEDTL